MSSRKIGGGLDKRAERISAELEEARKLRAEAEALLLEYERKRERAESEAAEIVAAAREEAERISKEAEIRLTEYISRRTASAEAKIAQAEEQAMTEVRDAAIAAAVKASETVLRGSVQGPLGEDLIKQGLADTRRTTELTGTLRGPLCRSFSSSRMMRTARRLTNRAHRARFFASRGSLLASRQVLARHLKRRDSHGGAAAHLNNRDGSP